MAIEVTTIKVEIHESAKDTQDFKNLKEFQVTKQELFKYAIMMQEVPKNIKESDFEYLQSKIPHLEGMYSEWIVLTKNMINNLSEDDRQQKIISEAIGVGVGLKYSVELLKVNPNSFKKIKPAKKGKYLDYSAIVDSKEYEIETKGTVGRYYSTMANDILEKKKDSTTDVYLKYGTITVVNKADETREVKCVIVDDPPNEDNVSEDDLFETQVKNYSLILSFILDSRYFNRFIRPALKNDYSKAKINTSKFFGRYKFKGKNYLGEYFDYRLVASHYKNKQLSTKAKKNAFFKQLTGNLGKTKMFIGVEESVLNAINEVNTGFLAQYRSEKHLTEKDSIIKFLDEDGILFVKSSNGKDEQIENIFTEEVVRERIEMYSNYVERNVHICGAPCRSKEKRGKSCAIRTYRSNCHFHR